MIKIPFILTNKEARRKAMGRSVKIQDYTIELPWHDTRMWNTRSIYDITHIVFHQPVTIATVQGINKYMITPAEDNHISKRGCPHIPYHLWIDYDEVYLCNPFTHVTWQTKGLNFKSIGISVRGDFSGKGHDGESTLTIFQRRTIWRLLDKLYTTTFKHLSVKKSLLGHCDFADYKPADPGYGIYSLIEAYRLQNK